MRPATAASFLAKNADLLAGFDSFARLNAVVDGLEMRVTVEPAMFIQHINVIVFSVRLVERRIRVSLHCFAAGRNHQTIASGNHIDQTFAAADVVPGMIVNFARRTISSIDTRAKRTAERMASRVSSTSSNLTFAFFPLESVVCAVSPRLRSTTRKRGRAGDVLSAANAGSNVCNTSQHVNDCVR